MEMGRREMMRRGGAKRCLQKQSGSGFAAKSKKVMLKKQQMGFEFPPLDLENEVSKKKSKLPKKNLKDINEVDHASVPRKLRSAMKKRNLESVSKLSFASKRLKRSKPGIESFEKDLIKKENQEMEEKAIPESMMISKDEKEVAETLYCLAGMFTETDSVHKKSSDEKETSKVDSKPESLEPAVSVSSSAKTKLIDEMPLEQPDKQLSSAGMVNRLKQSSSLNVTDAPARAIETKDVTSNMDYMSKGLALWPGLSSNGHSGAHVLPMPSSTKLPAWMGQAFSPSKSVSLVSEPLNVQPNKMKNCASHIYIARLIKVLQTSKNSPLTLSQDEKRSLEMSERGLPGPVTTIYDFKAKVSPSKGYQPLHRTQNPKLMQEGMTQLALELPNLHTSQKQSYDFLSLSSNGATQSHFPFTNSFPQYHISRATCSLQVQQQLSPYLASQFQTAYNANQQQQQQLQKRLWAAQYRPTSGNTVSTSNQFSKPNLSLNLTSIQPLQVASASRYNNNVSLQQHRLMTSEAAMSMSRHHNNNPSRTMMNRQEHHYPLIYEDTRTSLQLLCNEQS